MYPRTNYQMTQEDLDGLLAAMKPVPYMVIGGVPPRSRQENANAAWAALGAKMGFDGTTVEPSPDGDILKFTAVPNETPAAKAAREAQEYRDAKAAQIQQLQSEIATAQDKLKALQTL